MGDYFKPWRRKIGVVTLVMASAFVAAWIRSMFAGDYLRTERGDFSHVFISAKGELIYLSWNSARGFRLNDSSLGCPVDYLSKSYVHTITEMSAENRPFYDFHLPYWSVGVPLTLIAGILILWPSRRAKTQSVNSSAEKI